MSLIQWLGAITVGLVVYVFYYSIKLMVKDMNKETNTAKLQEWLNKVHPLPERKPADFSYVEKMKRKRKYKPKAVIKTHTKK